LEQVVGREVTRRGLRRRRDHTLLTVSVPVP
jgi:hypothetical protein